MMPLTPRDKIENHAIKKYDNQDLSKEHSRAKNKKLSKLRERKSWHQQNLNELDFRAEINSNDYYELLRTSSPEISAITTYCNPGVVYPNYSMPYTMSQWDLFTPQITNPVVPVPTVPVPLVTPPLPILTAPMLPYSDVLFNTTYSPIVPYISDNTCTALDQTYEPILSFAALTPVTSTDEEYNEIADEIEKLMKHELVESLENYLSLPKCLFPPAKMLTLDPNPIIDELCKIKDINKHTPWILDLEFGVPKAPISRPIAVYDVQCNNIHCKNTPGAVHPGFESCSEGFKQVFLFYYDCMVSVWYRGYIYLTNDDSVKNFQTWLIVPMQALGMCWP